MDRSDSWLHRALRRHLGRVAAPDELWDRVMLPQVQSLGPRNGRGVWVLAAASALAVSVFAATWGYVPRLGSGKARMEFQSANGSDIRTWIRNRTGLDIPLLRKPDASIEMIGARLIEGEGPTVEVSYRMRGEVFVLLATMEGFQTSGLLRHADLSNGALQNTRAVSWRMAGNTYTLAAPRAEDLHTACLVCHSESSL